jgi:O-antigen ligase
MRLVMLLPFLVILNGLSIPIAGVSVRADQLAACLLIVPLAASTLIGARRLHVDSTVAWLAALLAMNVIVSIAHSPTPTYSLLQCANLASVWVIYVVVLNGLDSIEQIGAFVRRVLWAAIVAGTIGVAAYLLAVTGLDLGGAEVSASAATRFTDAYGAYGVMVEPNLLGSFAAAHLVLAAALLTRGDGSDARLARWTAGVCAVAMVFSFTRAAWVGAIAGITGVGLLRSGSIVQRIREPRILRPLIAALVVAVALFFLPGPAGTLFRFKLANLVNFQTQTGVIRAVTYALALDQTAAHPWVGWGTFTFAPLTAEGVDFQRFENWRNLWIGNYVLLAVHDTGVIGLGLWIGLLWSIVARGVRAARVVGASAFGVTAAFLTLLIPFLATSGFSLGYPWLLAGILGACARVARVSHREAASAAYGGVDAPEQPMGGVVPGV